MSIFDNLLVAMDTVVDSVFADSEKFDFTPMTDVPNSDPEPDPDRSALTDIIAIFDDQASVLQPTEMGPARATTQPQIIVQLQYVPQGVQVGDRFTRKKDGQIYAVTDKQPDGLNRLVLPVIEVIA